MTQRRPAFRRFRTWFLIAAILSGGLAALIAFHLPLPHTAHLVIDDESDVSFFNVTFEGVSYHPLPLAAPIGGGVFIVEAMPSRSREPTLHVSWRTRAGEQRNVAATFAWGGEFWFCVMLLRIGPDGEVRSPERPKFPGEQVRRTCGYGK